MFKIFKGNLASYLRTLFDFRNTEYDLRNNQFKLNSYGGALLLNSLPEQIRSLTLFSRFKKAE